MRLARIVVGVDFSDASEAAARWVRRRVAPMAEVECVHVVEPVHEPRSMLPAPWLAAQVTAARAAAERRLAPLAASLAAPAAAPVAAPVAAPMAAPIGGEDAPPVRKQVSVGRVWEALLAEAARFGADLIVVGPHGPRERRWMPLGTTVQRLVRTSRTPVLIATHPRDGALQRLLVGLDDAEGLDAVLDAACTVSAQCGAAIDAVHVFGAARMAHLRSMAAVRSTSAAEADAQVTAELRREAARWRHALDTRGAAPGRVTVEVADGHPGEVLLDRARVREADLIIVGREGSGAVLPLLLGRTVQTVIHGAPCPVLIVPTPDAP